jgi:hypothetical protein
MDKIAMQASESDEFSRLDTEDLEPLGLMSPLAYEILTRILAPKTRHGREAFTKAFTKSNVRNHIATTLVTSPNLGNRSIHMAEVETMTAAFGKYLTTEWSRKQVPSRLDTAYDDVCKLPAGRTERIFLRVGFKPWLALILTARTKGKTFDGKAAQLRAIQFSPYGA